MFSSVKKTVSGRLRELVKQKLSALHESSEVRVCQLLCTVPLKTFQAQVLTNNPGTDRTDEYPSLVISHGQSCGLRLVQLTQD